MILLHEQKEHISEKLRGIVSKHAGPDTKLFYFGSRVDGIGDDRSDIDVGIETEQPLSSSALRAIQEEVEGLRTLYSIDVVDFSAVDSSFTTVAKQHIEFI